MDRYDELAAYKKKHGDTLVQQRSGPLGHWVNKQKQLRREGKLHKERIRLLNEIGFDWGTEIGPNTPWMDRYDELEEYKEKHGHTIVKQRSGPLGRWVDNQRQLRREGKLSDEKIQLLNEIGFVWNVRAGQFNFNYNKLVAFKEKHGHTKV
ncbi:hypothetical protein ACHAWC_001363, partial [Mediolabrus comicus]